MRELTECLSCTPPLLASRALSPSTRLSPTLPLPWFGHTTFLCLGSPLRFFLRTCPRLLFVLRPPAAALRALSVIRLCSPPPLVSGAPSVDLRALLFLIPAPFSPLRVRVWVSLRVRACVCVC